MVNTIFEKSYDILFFKNCRMCRPVCFYLGSRLKNSELLHWRQWCIEWNNYHRSTAVRQMLGDVPACSCECLDFFLSCHEHQDILGWRGFLQKTKNKVLFCCSVNSDYIIHTCPHSTHTQGWKRGVVFLNRCTDLNLAEKKHTANSTS